MHCYERHFPVAPVSRRLLVYGWIEVHEEAMIGVNEAASTLLFGDTITKTGPLSREKNTDSTGYPVDLPCCRSADTDKHHFGHAMGMSFGLNMIASMGDRLDNPWSWRFLPRAMGAFS